jgi:predicted anti-sigma-YlaC factor YlaD
MNCRTIQELLPDVALGITPAPPEVDRHLAECPRCRETLEALRATMSVLDEWQAPEPSPYWEVRMQARLREERQRASAGWLQWLRRPALSLAAALCLVVGVGGTYVLRLVQQQQSVPIAQTTGTAVSDLQFLEKNADMLQGFDALDDLNGNGIPDVDEGVNN